MSRWLRLAAPAKLNLMLQITGRRADGLHELQTVIDPIDWMDEVRIRRRRDGQIVRRHGPAWVATEQDLVVCAAQRLQQAAQVQQGVELAVVKRVPAGAGMGGGSAAAAAVLRGLNQLWGLHWSRTRLAELALGLGTDVPALVHAVPLWATGLGEVLTPLPLVARHYVVIWPGIGAPTAAMYAAPTLRRDAPGMAAEAWLEQPLLENVFEPLLVAHSAAVATALDWLRARLPDARLTGSGSAVFATAADRRQAQALVRTVPAGWQARACRSWRGAC